jgi:hypothetical protein
MLGEALLCWVGQGIEKMLSLKNNQGGRMIMNREEILREAERRGYEYEQKYRV